MSVLGFEAVTKIYAPANGPEVRALAGVTFDVAAGECCCLIGPNGAGKTTSIMMLVGFTPITSGRITVNGASVGEDPVAARRHMTYLPSEVALYENLTGEENLRFFGELIGKPDRALALEAGQRVGLDPVQLARPMRTYSKGMKQRLAIAISLLKEASLYIFDEPTTGLDAIGIRDFLGMLTMLRERGKAILVTTHDLLHVSSFATKAVFLLNGQIAHKIEGDALRTTNLEDEYVRLVQGAATPA